MTLLDALSRGARRTLKISDDGRLISDGDAAQKLLGMFGDPTTAGPTVTPESALGIIAINAAVQLKVAAVRGIPLVVYYDTTGGPDYSQGKRAFYYELVHNRPNPEQTADELWSEIVGHLDYRANAFLWKEKWTSGPRTGLLKWLWPLDPRRVRPKRVDGVKVYEILSAPGGQVIATMGDDQIVHIKSGLISADGLRGVSAIEQCRQEVGTHIATRQYLAQHIGNGANFRGYLSIDDDTVDVDQTERDRIEEKLVKPARGPSGTSSVPLFNAKLKWTQIGMSLADQEFIDLLEMGVEDAARMMSVPPTMLNAPVRSGSLTYTTTAQEEQRFLNFGVAPHLKAIERALDHDPDIFGGVGYHPEFRREAVLAMDVITRYTAHALAINARWKTPNEVRAIEGLADVDGGDRLLGDNAKADVQTRALLTALENARLDGDLQRLLAETA